MDDLYKNKVYIVGDYKREITEIKEQLQKHFCCAEGQLAVLHRDFFPTKMSKFDENSRFVFVSPVLERYAIYDEDDVANSFKREIDEAQHHKGRSLFICLPREEAHALIEAKW
eukprot:m.249459 g.249459  ORF g.249459 m.249459 type:complete len:113 (+) comp40302_c0_seq3:618-956(+)